MGNRFSGMLTSVLIYGLVCILYNVTYYVPVLKSSLQSVKFSHHGYQCAKFYIY